MAKETENKKNLEEKKVTTDEFLKERVPFVIHRPQDSKEEFTTVTINGRNYQIEYGKTVMIPRFVKDAIINSYRADNEAQEKQKGFLELFNQKAGAL